MSFTENADLIKKNNEFNTSSVQRVSLELYFQTDICFRNGRAEKVDLLLVHKVVPRIQPTFVFISNIMRTSVPHQGVAFVYQKIRLLLQTVCYRKKDHSFTTANARNFSYQKWMNNACDALEYT